MEKEQDWKDKLSDTAKEIQQKAEAAWETIEEKAEQLMDKAEDKAEELLEKARSGELKQEAKEKMEELAADELYLSKVAKLGAEKARASASKTVREVREIIGFRHF